MDLEWLAAVVVIAGIAWLTRRRRGPVRVDAEGILIARSPSNPLYLSWDEIESFGIASVTSIDGGLHQPGFTQYVGIRLTESCEKKRTPVCADNRMLSDYDLLLTPDRGVPVDRFAAYLESERAKFKKG